MDRRTMNNSNSIAQRIGMTYPSNSAASPAR